MSNQKAEEFREVCHIPDHSIMTQSPRSNTVDTLFLNGSYTWEDFLNKVAAIQLYSIAVSGINVLTHYGILYKGIKAFKSLNSTRRTVRTKVQFNQLSSD